MVTVEYCAICGTRIRFIKVRIKDGYICGPCQSKLPQKYWNIKEELDAEQIRKIVKEGEERDNARPDLLQAAMKPIRERMEKERDPEEELRRYHRLLEDGLITEEDYEKKKKEILGL